ncbi:hypothetical protein I6N90_09135 [Paenibacillus sp. GSMTC-2017]|uniref:hypothetical protein n=1 Tax=Paenibacillus sp. GSMTC-2017 TaxID=2794350 RepID=UPI0018D788B9|nr:hypothetical protein [Paenibacillus sp. GSMTC-2017]MBH5317967.1 hypothetical protein [Paenibacillus sp. GSMTC-2017]
MSIFSKRIANRSLRLSATIVAITLFILPLTGCLYPKENMKQNVPPKEAVRNVQGAIDQYYADLSLLPIINSGQDVPKYEKFRIDFTKLKSKNYLSSAPGAAFESGGNYYFLVLDEDTKPRVKLLDIVGFQKINDVQNWVKLHMQEGGVLPKKDAMYPGFYEIDYSSMNKKAPIIKSVFSGQTLQALIDDNGIVYTDYGIDIMQLIQKKDSVKVAENDDLRELLVDSSDFVPVKAPFYKLVNGEPVAVHQ